MPLHKEVQSLGRTRRKRRVLKQLGKLRPQSCILGQLLLGHLLGHVVFQVFLLLEDRMKEAPVQKRVGRVRL